jgi:hypothetical protein
MYSIGTVLVVLLTPIDNFQTRITRIIFAPHSEVIWVMMITNVMVVYMMELYACCVIICLLVCYLTIFPCTEMGNIAANTVPMNEMSDKFHTGLTGIQPSPGTHGDKMAILSPGLNQDWTGTQPMTG